MQLSVIIVNYNVKYFLEQALHSVYKAMQGVHGEVFVVDNNSADGSCEMVRRKFPQTIVIENKSNTGFSVANNQAIKQANGKYVLLLNPDTVVEEDCFRRCVDFMDTHQNAGALGVKMIDGKGKFLPESKRSLPTPKVAFYKMFGFASVFPKSKTFGKYHLGFLSNDEVHEVEVLSGAFMFIRKATLDKIGLLDEDYFMYGEDIDLSYRVTQGGYKNYYFPNTTIIHYKGESTKKTSVNYVFVFYRAMIIFAQKHYSNKHAKLFSFLISFAIYIRAGISLVARFFQIAHLMIMDATCMYLGIYLIKLYWERNHKFVEGGSYPIEFMLVNASIYTIIWVFGLYLSGAYEKTRSTTAVVKGILFGLIGISLVYAFAPLSYRFSRAIIMLGFVWALIFAYLNRLVLYVAKFKKIDLAMAYDTTTIIVGGKNEASRVQDLLNKTKANCKVAGYVTVGNDIEQGDDYLGDVSRLRDIVQVFNAEEVIFCSKDISATQIIQWMSGVNLPGMQYKIVPEESTFIIGSNSKNSAGDFYALDISMALSEPQNQRKKRILDVVVTILLTVICPILLLVIKQRANFIKNLWEVLFGQKTWVGYTQSLNQNALPKIKQGVLSPVINWNNQVEPGTANKLNFMYAKNYSVEKDLYIILISITKLGS
jgi:GT2 family glycosyltransferase/lipopolysaccharide/colanic/teichoic acid biosynthesis glycosyltransferase